MSKESYDPNFAYYRHRFGGDRDLGDATCATLYAGRCNGDVARPPHTLVQQTT